MLRIALWYLSCFGQNNIVITKYAGNWSKRCVYRVMGKTKLWSPNMLRIALRGVLSESCFKETCGHEFYLESFYEVYLPSYDKKSCDHEIRLELHYEANLPSYGQHKVVITNYA